MNVFSKYLLKSITGKKGRTFLLLISIAISSALLVASMGSIKALLGTLTTQMKANYGNFNVQINPKQSLGVPLFKPMELNTYDIKNSYKEIDIGGYLSSNQKEFSLVGTTLADFNNFNTMKILKSKELSPFEGKKLIVSQKTSELLKVKLGSKLKLNILGKEQEYIISGIASNMGRFFFDNEKAFTFITPENNIFSIYGEKNMYSSQLLSVSNGNIEKWISDFNSRYKFQKIVASKLYDEKQMEQQLSMIRIPLYFMLAIVLLMTTFIIYSSFKLIITERMPIIGVFLSQGATKNKIILLMLRESIAYGVLGGALGDGLGAGLTKLIAVYGNPLKEFGVSASTEYYPLYFVIGFIFAVMLSLASTIVPILAIRRLPIKDVILNTLGTKNKVSLKSFAFGILCIGLSLVLHFLGKSTNNLGAIPSLFLALIGFICIIPKLVEVVFSPIVKGLRNINGISMLAFNNVRTSKVLINNMRLIAVSVVSIVMITSLSVSLTELVKGAYKEMKFDIRIDISSNNTKNANEIIMDYKDSKSVSGTGMIVGKLNGADSKTIYLNYVDPIKYKTFENYTVWDNKEKSLNELNLNDDGIIISTQIATRYKIKKNDYISVNEEDKNEKLKVIDIFNAKLMDSGNYNLISLKCALKHFDIKYPVVYYIDTKVTPENAKKTLEKSLKGLGANVMTKSYMSKQNEDNNKQMTDILSIFSYLTMVIGAFGILSNVTISFIQRKRELAVISSIGMTKGGRSYLILMESIFEALVGGCISLIAAYGINILFEDIFKFIKMDIKLRYPIESIVPILIATLILMLLTTVTSLLKSRRFEIVKELKYE